MKEWYNERPGYHRLPKLRLKNVVAADGFAELHSPLIKAANKRAAAPLFRDLAQRHLSPHLPFDALVCQVLANLAEWYGILYDAPMFVPPPALERLQELTVSIGEDWMRLRELSRRASLLHWKITPKVHKLQHVPFYASILNPRFVQCHLEEGLIGTTAKVWQKTMRVRYASSVESVVLAKQTIGLLLRFGS